MDNYTGLMTTLHSPPPPPPPPSSSCSAASFSTNMSTTVSNTSHLFVSEMEAAKSNMNIGSPDPKRTLLLGGSEVGNEVVMNNRGNNNGEEKKKKKGKGSEMKVKKPRYAFQTRSQVDILDDGYKWRKYGQKAVKNNKFPRSYYKCTHQGCNVKKQVQRLTKDEGVVVTTYEGVHSHPIEKYSHDNFEHILAQMQLYTPSF